MNHQAIYEHQPLWGSWNIEELIGIGSYGSVYKVSKDLFGNKAYSAVKYIPVPGHELIKNIISAVGSDEQAKTACIKNSVNAIVGEIQMLIDLRGHSNILSYEDHMIIENPDNTWDIFVRMEYSTPLDRFIQDNPLTIQDVIKIGIDICEALNFCHSKDIIHRDIKEDNIFFSGASSFKLGDFGIAKNMLSQASAQTKAGTLSYMAPEILMSKNYDKTVDFYSLGLVLYKLLNNGKIPFLHNNSSAIKFSDIELAQAMRLSGEPLPIPKNADSKFSDIVLKACSFDPSHRYQSAYDFKKDLMALLDSNTEHEKNQIVFTPSRKQNNPVTKAHDDEGADKTQLIMQSMTQAMFPITTFQKTVRTSIKNTRINQKVIITVLGSLIVTCVFIGYLMVFFSNGNKKALVQPTEKKYVVISPAFETTEIPSSATPDMAITMSPTTGSPNPLQSQTPLSGNITPHQTQTSTIPLNSSTVSSPITITNPPTTVDITAPPAPTKSYSLDISYQVHIVNDGWTSWATNGNVAGTIGQVKQLEAIKIRAADQAFTINYQAHSMNIGWGPIVSNGALAGTTGENRRLEAVRIWLVNAPAGYHVEYRAHVSNVGWQNWVRDGSTAGTVEQLLQMEAICIRLLKE